MSSQYKNYRGHDVTDLVFALIKQSGIPEKKWCWCFGINLWYTDGFAYHILTSFIAIKDYSLSRNNVDKT